MVNDRPTVYNTSSVYKEAGGGGGGGGGDIPENISLYMKLKENVSARFSQSDLNQFPIKDTDIVNVLLELNLMQTNGGVYASIFCLDTQPLSGEYNSKNLKCVSFGGTSNSFIFDKNGYSNNMNVSDVGDSFYLLSLTMYEKDITVKFNGEIRTAYRNVQINNDLAIVQMWPNTGLGFNNMALFYLYGLTIKTNEGVLKYDFCPALNTDTNKIGLFEKVNGIFIAGNNNNNFELIGEL